MAAGTPHYSPRFRGIVPWDSSSGAFLRDDRACGPWFSLVRAFPANPLFYPGKTPLIPQDSGGRVGFQGAAPAPPPFPPGNGPAGAVPPSGSRKRPLFPQEKVSSREGGTPSSGNFSTGRDFPGARESRRSLTPRKPFARPRENVHLFFLRGTHPKPPAQRSPPGAGRHHVPPRDGGRWPLPFGGAQPSRTTVVGEG